VPTGAAVPKEAVPVDPVYYVVPGFFGVKASPRGGTVKLAEDPELVFGIPWVAVDFDGVALSVAGASMPVSKPMSYLVLWLTSYRSGLEM